MWPIAAKRSPAPCFFTIAVIAGACFQAPDALIVSGFGGLIISLAQVSKAGSARFSHPFLVYLGEISYSVYMVCIPWEVLFVNVAVKIGHFSGKQLPPLLWLIFVVTLIPLAAATHHLIEKPARERMKLWRTLARGSQLCDRCLRGKDSFHPAQGRVIPYRVVGGRHPKYGWTDESFSRRPLYGCSRRFRAGWRFRRRLLAVRPLRPPDVRHPDFRRRVDLVEPGRAAATRPATCRRPARCSASVPPAACGSATSRW